MQVLERLIDADTFLELEQLPDYRDREYELIYGEMVEMSVPGSIHGKCVLWLSAFIAMYLLENDVGEAMAESGNRSELDPYLLLRPDVSFISHASAREPLAEAPLPRMPDLAVEVASPSNSVHELREKAEIYLRNETQLVWLVFPRERRVEVHRADGSMDELSADDALSGEAVLPGFSLDLRELFSLLDA